MGVWPDGDSDGDGERGIEDPHVAAAPEARIGLPTAAGERVRDRRLELRENEGEGIVTVRDRGIELGAREGDRPADPGSSA